MSSIALPFRSACASPLPSIAFNGLNPSPNPVNVHLVVLDDPQTDGAIVATHCGKPSSPHGYQGSWTLDASAKAARLWMPQLGRGKRPMLELVHQFVTPHAVCPILPFPATHPRFADSLIEEFGDLFETPWQVDARDLVYAYEKSPVDLYRTILRIDDARRRVFEGMGGSQVILSPVGSKALALGMLMACWSGNLPLSLSRRSHTKSAQTFWRAKAIRRPNWSISGCTAKRMVIRKPGRDLNMRHALTKNLRPVAVGTGLLALDVIVNAETEGPPQCFAGGSCGNVLTILSYLDWNTFPVARLSQGLATDRCPCRPSRMESLLGIHLHGNRWKHADHHSANRSSAFRPALSYLFLAVSRMWSLPARLQTGPGGSRSTPDRNSTFSTGFLL